MAKRAKVELTRTERAALYARVSTAAQLDNTSPDGQLRRAGQYCREHSYEVVATEIEDVSGVFVLARSKFNSFLDLAADGRLDVIVVDIPDRLGRGDAIAKLELLAELNGARVEYATPGRDPNTVEGLALKATDQLVSGIERQNIRRRTMNGKTDWARRGRIIASPYRPFGYDYLSTYNQLGHKLSCQLVVNEAEAPVIVQIYELMVNEALTLRTLAKRLNSLGIATRSGKTKWAPQTLGTLIRSATYKGEWAYGKTIKKRIDTVDGVKQRLVGHRDVADLAIVPCPAIVGPELWAAAQAQLEENCKKFVRPTVRQYLLRSRIKCARCSRRMRGEGGWRRHREYQYYVCCMKTDVVHPCPAKAISVPLVDGAVWECVVEALQHPERVLIGAEEQRREFERARRLLEGSLAGLDAESQKDQQGLERVFELFRDGHAPKSKYLAEQVRVESRGKKRAAERTELVARLAEQSPLSEDDDAYIRAFAKDIADRLHPGVPFEEKVKLLDILRVECIYDDRTGELVVSGLMGHQSLSIISK